MLVLALEVALILAVLPLVIGFLGAIFSVIADILNAFKD